MRSSATGGRPFLAAVGVSQAIAGINTTAVGIALPAIREEFDISLATVTWLVTAYLVTMAVGQLVGGRLGDSYGHRRVFLIGLALGGSASVAATFAWDFPSLLVIRLLQGFGFSMVSPNTMAILGNVYGERERGRAFGLVWSAIIGGTTLGPVVVGPLIGISWRLAFMSSAVVAVPALVLALAVTPRPTSAPSRQPLDFPGVVLLTGSVLAFALFAGFVPDPLPTAIAGGLALALLAGFVAWERRYALALVRPALARVRSIRAIAAAMPQFQLVIYTVTIATPVFFISVRGESEAVAGAMLAALLVPSVPASIVGGRLADRLGRRIPTVVGGIIATLGPIELIFFGIDSGYAVYGVGLALVGVGFGLMQASMQSAVVESAPPGLAASAGGLYQLTRQLGSVVGAALFAAIVGSTTAGSDAADYRTLFVVLAGAGVVGVLISLAIHTWPPRADPPSP